MTSQKKSQKIARLAELIAGSSGIPEANLGIVRSFLARAGISEGIIARLLEQPFADWPSHVIRLLAVQLYFEKTKPFDDETKRGIGDMERRLEQTVWSPAKPVSTWNSTFRFASAGARSPKTSGPRSMAPKE